MDNKKLIPNLRFPEFKGVWKSSELKKITSYVDYRGRAPKKSNKGHFLVTAKNIKKGYIDYDCSKEFVAEEDYSTVMSKGLPLIGDVLFTTEAPMGNVAQVNKKDITLAQRVIKFRGSELIDNSFLLYYMLSNVFQKTIKTKAIGSTVQGISGKELHKTIVSFPKLSEQEKIASFLTEVDSKLTQLTKKKALLENYKKGVMQKIFNQKIRFKDNKGNNYPNWEEKTLGEVFKVSAGGDIKKINVSKEKTEDFKFPIFANSEKKEGLYGYSNIYKIDFECITVTGRGSLGNAIARYKKFYPIVRLLVLKPKIKLNVFFFENIINQLNILSESTGVPQLTAPQVSKYKLNFPCLEEQEKIANFLSEIDNKIKTLNTKIENNKSFKKGLLQKMFV
ncbi:restriction endonuclease subunit S [Tenacibaculum dicentrarchi]|uniref:restriction endonuclease subunit S n=1 Tax=Tenacibaculum dicentrarchi TaxID=669041 RepID=UPI003515F1BE